MQLTSGTGQVLWRYEYDAFGNERDIDGQAPANDTNPFRYCGEYFDKETGTIYLRARNYNPATGRFLSQDPIRSGLNWYGYCSGNPIALIDPSGLVWMNTMDMLKATGNSGTINKGRVNFTMDGRIYNLSKSMDSATFAQIIGLNNRFGSYNSNITAALAEIYIRSEYANMKLKEAETAKKENRSFSRFQLDPSHDYYLLDYGGHTIQLHMGVETMVVNMHKHDARRLILSRGANDLAGWLHDVYAYQHDRPFGVGQRAMAIELFAHAAPDVILEGLQSSPGMSGSKILEGLRESTKNANIGTLKGFELLSERLLWDVLAYGMTLPMHLMLSEVIGA